MTEELDLNLFKQITSFVKKLDECFGKEYKQIVLYSHLLGRTTFEDDGPIAKHIAAFRQFFTTNSTHICNKNFEKFESPEIRFSNKVYFDMQYLFKLCGNDRECTDTLWRHLLVLLAIFNPSSEAKKILKVQPSSDEKFINNLMGKVQTIAPKIESGEDIMTTVVSMLTSGTLTTVISEVQQGLESGELSINGMLDTIKVLCAKSDTNSFSEEGVSSQVVDIQEVTESCSTLMIKEK